MLVTWRYRKRSSLIQSFDPRAWFIFYACFLVSTLLFWDLRYLAFFLAIALFFVFTSRHHLDGDAAAPGCSSAVFVIFFAFADLPDRARRDGSVHQETS